MITIRHISKSFGKLKVLDNVSLQLDPGECIALIGPNGCGKTTLIKSILAMVLPDEGSIFFEGKDIRNDNLYRAGIGYMPQIGRYPENMTIGQVIDMVTGIRNSSSAPDMALYEEFGISRLLDKRMGTLSGGTTQKVSATLAFMFNPRVLILDEPTAGLDPLAAGILKDKIMKSREEGRLTLITSHLLSELEDLISRLIFMQEGRVVLHKDVDELKNITGQDTVARSVLQLLKSGEVGVDCERERKL